jgi:hypothetical protein
MYIFVFIYLIFVYLNFIIRICIRKKSINLQGFHRFQNTLYQYMHLFYFFIIPILGLYTYIEFLL